MWERSPLQQPTESSIKFAETLLSGIQDKPDRFEFSMRSLFRFLGGPNLLDLVR